MFKTGNKEKIVHLGLRLPKSVHLALAEEATRQRRSLNDQIIHFIEAGLGLMTRARR